MRGDDQQPDGLFSYVSPEQRVPADHPLRRSAKLADEVLKRLRRGSINFTPSAGHRSRQRSCCERCCCKCSTAYAASGC